MQAKRNIFPLLKLPENLDLQMCPDVNLPRLGCVCVFKEDCSLDISPFTYMIPIKLNVSTYPSLPRI